VALSTWGMFGIDVVGELGSPGVSAGKFTVRRISHEALRRLKISFINENSEIGVQNTTR
jgi:hypothetical protein